MALVLWKGHSPSSGNLGSRQLGAFTKLVACWPFPGQMTSRKAPVFMWK